MKCITCGNEVSNNESVCPYCGTSRAVNQHLQEADVVQNAVENNNQQKSSGFCISCGKSIPTGYKLCPECTEKQALESYVPEKKKNYTWLIVLLTVLILLFGAVAVGFWTGFFDEYIGADEASDSSNRDEDEKNSEKDTETDNDESKDKDDTDDDNTNDDNTNDDNTNKNDNTGGVSGRNNDGTDDDMQSEENKKNKESVYEITVLKDNDKAVSWSTAYRNANDSGGRLLCINSKEEFEKIVSMLDSYNDEIKVIWVGAKRTPGKNWENVKWLDGSNLTFTRWLDGEPTYYSDGEEELYLMIFKVGDEWYFNDAANDVSEFYPSKSVGYIIEKEK